MPGRKNPGEFRGYLAILASLALFLFLNSDIISRIVTLSVSVLGWNTIRHLLGILLPLAIVAADRYHVTLVIQRVKKKLENTWEAAEDWKNSREARQIMEKVYRLRNG